MDTALSENTSVSLMLNPNSSCRTSESFAGIAVKELLSYYYKDAVLLTMCPYYGCLI